MRRNYGIGCLAIWLAMPLGLGAQEAHDMDHTMNDGAGHETAATPQEVGQAQFAAIAEIVTLLDEDPKTNWAEVDIDSLRAHLLDMDRVMTQSNSTTSLTENSVIFEVTGQGETIASIKRMSAAHAAMIEGENGWAFDVEPTAQGARIEVLADQEGREKLQALGFYGLLTLDAHHQGHHFLIAKGQAPHE